MKIKLVKIDDERSKGRGFMKRVKERWDLEFPEQASVSMSNLINNALFSTRTGDKGFDISEK